MQEGGTILQETEALRILNTNTAQYILEHVLILCDLDNLVSEKVIFVNSGM